MYLYKHISLSIYIYIYNVNNDNSHTNHAYLSPSTVKTPRECFCELFHDLCHFRIRMCLSRHLTSVCDLQHAQRDLALLSDALHRAATFQDSLQDSSSHVARPQERSEVFLGFASMMFLLSWLLQQICLNVFPGGRQEPPRISCPGSLVLQAPSMPAGCTLVSEDPKTGVRACLKAFENLPVYRAMVCMYECLHLQAHM